MVGEYGRNLRLEMPHGDWSGGGGGGGGSKAIQYYLALSLGAFADAQSTAGAAILRALGKLEQLHPGDVLLRYPMPGTEDGFRSNLLKKVQPPMAKALAGSSVFVVIAGKPLEDFHGDVHSFAVIDFDSYFNEGGTLNEQRLSKDLGVFSGLIRENSSIIAYIQSLPAKRPSWVDALELKPGIFGIRFDLRKYAQQQSKA